MSVVEILPDHIDHRANLGSWVAKLASEFPHHDEYDLAALIEERSGKPVHQTDFETIRAIYLRSRFQVFQPDEED